MFGFFKNKNKTLKEIIPANFIDIHSHLLYGLDDGSKSLNETKQLIADLQKFGFSQFIVTPHTTPLVWENTKDGILNQHQKVKNELGMVASDFRVASEYLIDDSFLKRLENERLLTLKDNYVLIEMSYINPPIHLYEIIMELNSQGYQPVLAHPERYNFYKSDYDSFKRLKNAGCLFQMNMLSSTGYYGMGITTIADYLLKENMYDFAGSDVLLQRHINDFSSELKVKNVDAFESLLFKNVCFKSE